MGPGGAGRRPRERDEGTPLMPHIVDRLLAALGLLVLAPLVLAAAIWIKLDSRGPVLYRQQRVGKDGRTFEMLKLRTMAQGSDPVGVGTVVGEGDPRVTRSGEPMRRTSFDEVPNLVNVLRGQMAIVGPRPTPTTSTSTATPASTSSPGSPAGPRSRAAPRSPGPSASSSTTGTSSTAPPGSTSASSG